jgi:hypothetical protein
MLPVSGAEQLKTSLAHGTRPMISARGAYSVLVRPAPSSVTSRPAPSALGGRNRFHKPAARALGLSCSINASGVQRLPARVLASSSAQNAGSAG